MPAGATAVGSPASPGPSAPLFPEGTEPAGERLSQPERGGIGGIGGFAGAVAAQAMQASGRISRAPAGRSSVLECGCRRDAASPGDIAEARTVGEAEEDGPRGVHEFRNAGRALVGVQGEDGSPNAGTTPGTRNRTGI